MRAKILTQLSILFMAFMLLAPAAYAGDTDQWIARGDQDALVIGKVTSYKDGMYTVDVQNTLMGTMEEKKIKIAFPHNPNSVEPAAGDYGLFSLDEDDDHYKSAYGVYKVDSPDYRTLKIARAVEHDGIRERLQQFINSGAFMEKQKQAPAKEAAVSISTKTATAEPIKASAGMSYLPFIIVGGIALFALTAITAVLMLKRKRT
ncbi:hypothetical protein SD71_11275 [Cohnella kolymensis]|uniref:Uncharacterized protein n=1 Tax=Cohnella kolymensis TaxID=1590652 RepID=A0ABR5A4H2_9BACL|nr:hypothetical protein [Cohnella kolymensis]KIL35941.1 hypothetical protein SD71_11275 [Cohnella kolymensis]